MSEIHKLISITNQKGGVGKTTTALNLGAALAASGKRVLLVDNDPQGNLTAALGFTPAEQKYTLANLLLAAIDYPEDLALHLKRGVLHTKTGSDLIPANRRLADAAARLQVMQLSQYNAVGDAEQSCEKIMDKLLAPLKGNYDYIIIDCGLKHELLTVNALAASDYCIIPVQAHFLASEGIPEVLELVKSVQASPAPSSAAVCGKAWMTYTVIPSTFSIRLLNTPSRWRNALPLVKVFSIMSRKTLPLSATAV